MANNQQVTFNLGINTKADLSGINEVKQKLAEVKEYASNFRLDEVMTTGQFNDLISSANKLENALTSAYNPKLNTVNVSKFNKILKQSGTSLSDIQSKLAIAGTVGQQAFLKATSQLMHMNNTLVKTDGFLNRMAKSFGNVVRYQTMNAILNKITSSISQANGYVKSLDTSLNNIQVVTEKSSESMKQFAKEANNAAKVLGATTTDYTDASLIYYQQGLSDEAVTDRTNTTMKMANVLGETASEVSDYMTAIWNNFDDGSKSLEYYGDVITKLGAETASSSAEIATGMSKFAAVADTVGLSYEYAAASLATVVAVTRQSADSVGTSFKTIFARLQGLKLGETLEDGTSLNKYSQALDAVGVNIKDQNGQLKDMDTLLDELGSKWQSLNKDEQVALAQTVAGTRQYTQLVALMENWEQVKVNIGKASDATGTLEEKNAIYLDSIQAHLNTAKAEWEDFFDSLLSEDLLKNLADAGGTLAKVLTHLTDSLGGLGPILTGLGSIGLNVFNNQLSVGISNLINKLREAKETTKTFEENFREIQNLFGQNSWTANASLAGATPAMTQAMNTMVEHYERLAKYSSIMTEEDKVQLDAILREDELLGEQNIKLEEQVGQWKRAVERVKIMSTDFESVKGNVDGLANGFSNFNNLVNKGAFRDGGIDLANVAGISSKDLKAAREEIADAVKKAGGDVDQFRQIWANVVEKPVQSFKDLNNALQRHRDNIKQAKKDIEDYKLVIEDITKKELPALQAQLAAAQQNVKAKENPRSKTGDYTGKSAESQQKQAELVQAREEEKRILEEIKKKEDDLTYANQVLEEVEKDLKDQVVQVTEAQKKRDETSKELEKDINSFIKRNTDVIATTVTLSNETDNLTERMRISAAAVDEMVKRFSLTKVISNVTKLTSSIGQLASGLMSIANLSNIWKSDESTAKKILQTVTTLSFALPMVATSLKTIFDIEKWISVEIGLQVGLEKIRIGLLKTWETITTVAKALKAFFSKEGQAQLVQERQKTLELQKQAAILLLQNKLKTVQADSSEATVLSNGISALQTGTFKNSGSIINVLKGAGIAGTEAAAGIGAAGSAAAGTGVAMSATAATATGFGAIIVAAIAATIIGIKIYQKCLDNVADKSESLAKKSSEYTEELKEESENIKKLTDAYNDLKDSWDDIDEDEKRLKVYELCLQYEQQALAIKALTANYQELDDVINETNADINKQLSISSVETINAARQAISDSSNAYATKTNKIGSNMNGEGINDDFIGISNLASQDNLVKDLEKLGIDIYGGGKSGETGFNVQNFVNAAINNKEELEQLFETYSDNKSAQAIKKYYEAISSNIDILANSFDNLKTSIINSDYAINQEVSSLKEYYQRIDEIATTLQDSGVYADREDAIKYAKQELLKEVDDVSLAASLNLIDIISSDISYPENKLSEAGQAYVDKLAETIITEEVTDEGGHKIGYKAKNSTKVYGSSESAKQAEALAQVKRDKKLYQSLLEYDILDYEEKLAEILQNKNIGFISFLSDNIDLFSFDADNFESQLEQIEKQYDDTIVYMEKKNKIEISVSIMRRATENGKYTEDDINELFDGRTQLESGVSRETFENAGFGNQQLYNLEDYMAQQEAVLNDETLKENAEKEQTSKLRQLQEYTAKNVSGISDYAYAQMLAAGQDTTHLIGSRETSIKNSLRDFSLENSLDNNILNQLVFTDEDYDESLLEYYNNLTDEQKAYVDELKEDGSLIASYNKQAEILADNIANLENGTMDYTEAIESLNLWLDREQESINNIKNTYSSLSDACEDYNNNQALTSESLNDLLDMSPQYLRYLQMQDGQLQINTAAMEEDTRATIALEAAEFAELQLSQLKKAIEDDNVEVYLRTTAATLAGADANWIFVESALTEIDTLVNENEALQAAGNAAKDYAAGVRAAIEAMRGTFDNFNLDNFYGKSSKSSKSKQKDKKEWDDEFDRYYTLKKAISDVEDTMSDLDKLQKHLHGKQLLEALDKQNKLLAEQKKRYEDLIAEQQKEGAELRANLSTFEGMTFAQDGNITNYAQVTTEQLNKYNEAVDKYNAGSLTDEAFEQIEKEYEAFKKDLSRYESLLKEFQDANNKLDDIYYEELANNLKSWETEIQLQLDLTEAERDWAKFLKNLDTDVRLRFTDINANLKLNTLNMEQLGLDKETLETAMNETMDEIYKFVADKNYKSDKFASLSEAQEELKKYKDSWVSTINEIRSNWEDAYDDYLQGIDDEAEKLEDIVTEYERLSAQIEHISNLNSLLYGANNYAINDNLYASQANIQLKQMSDFRNAAEMWNEYYLKAIEEGDEKAAQKFQENYREAIDNLYTTEEGYIQTLLNSYSNKINEIFDNLDKKLSGSTTSWLSEQWDAEKKAADGYYDSIERVYELETMESKWEAALNNTSSLKAQQKMKALMDEELSSLEGKTELSEYDIGLAEKRLAIAEAQAALEDAQNNKNTMKLTRGADGNWSYQYVADDGDVADKQQALLDAQHEAYEYAKENWMGIQEDILDIQQEALTKLHELQLARSSATDEEKALIDEQIEYYKNYYQNILTRLYTESNEREINLKTEAAALTLGLYNADKDNYDKMTSAEKLLIDDLMNHSITDLTEIYTASGDTMEEIQRDADAVLLTDNDSISALWNSAAANMVRRWYNDSDSVKNMFEIAISDCKIAQQSLDEAIEQGTYEAGEDYRELGEQIDEVSEKTDELAYNTEDACERACEAIDSYKWYVDQLKSAYDDLTTGVYGYVESIKEALIQNQNLADTSIANFNAIAEAAARAGIATSSTDTGGPVIEDKNKYQIYGVDKYGHSAVDSNRGQGYTKAEAEALKANLIKNGEWRNSDYGGVEILDSAKHSDAEMNEYLGSIGKAKYKIYLPKSLLGDSFYSKDGFNSRNEAEAWINSFTTKASNHNNYAIVDKDGGIIRNYGTPTSTIVNEASEFLSQIKNNVSKYVSTYDTGGYTGEWNDGSGRLAMLHSKELVLNAEDTKNMLETVSAVRSLSSIGSSISDAIANNIANMLMNIGTNVSLAGNATNSDNVVNNFDIVMDVDGGDVNEIKEAILSLPTLASQYMSKNLR